LQAVLDQGGKVKILKMSALQSFHITHKVAS